MKFFATFFSLARTNFFSLDNINWFCCLTFWLLTACLLQAMGSTGSGTASCITVVCCDFTSLTFLDTKISIEGKGLWASVNYKPGHRSSLHPSPFLLFMQWRLWFFPKNQRQCASFSMNVAILFLSFKLSTLNHAQQIDRQKTLQTVQKDTFQLLRNNSETGTIFSQRRLISFKRD